MSVRNKVDLSGDITAKKVLDGLVSELCEIDEAWLDISNPADAVAWAGDEGDRLQTIAAALLAALRDVTA